MISINEEVKCNSKETGNYGIVIVTVNIKASTERHFKLV